MRQSRGRRGRTAGALRTAASLALALGTVAVGAAVPSGAAWADGGVSYVESHYMGEQDELSPAPSDIWSVTMMFDKNVGYPRNDQDPAFIEENLAHMHLYDSAGNEVEGARFYPGTSHEERQIIYMGLDEWLKPLETYTVVADAGIQAANGTDVTTEAYRTTFKTSALCENGLTVFDMGAAACAVAVVAAGVAVAVVRRVRSTR